MLFKKRGPTEYERFLVIHYERAEELLTAWRELDRDHETSDWLREGMCGAYIKLAEQRDIFLDTGQ